MNNIQYDKPAKTYSQLIQGLKDKGLNIDSSNEHLIEETLKRHNYYSIVNGNNDVFLDKSSKEEKFLAGTTFSDLKSLYDLDYDIKNLLFKYILEIEVSVKSKLAYVVANNIGVEEPKITYVNGNKNYYDFSNSYLDKSYYSQKVKTMFFVSIANSIHKTKNNPTKYYRENKNHIPPWIAFENLYLYQIKDLCKFSSEDNKKRIGNLFTHVYDSKNHSISYENLINCLGVVQEFRNKVAHGQRFYKYKADNSYISNTNLTTLTTYNIVSTSEYSQGIGKNDIFSLLIAIVILIDDEFKAQFIVSQFPSMLKKYNNEDAFFRATNLPRDYHYRLTQLIRSIY